MPHLIVQADVDVGSEPCDWAILQHSTADAKSMAFIYIADSFLEYLIISVETFSDSIGAERIDLQVQLYHASPLRCQIVATRSLTRSLPSLLRILPVYRSSGNPSGNPTSLKSC